MGHRLVLDRLVVSSDFSLPKHHRLLKELTLLRRDVCAKLALPHSDEPIYVHLFETPERYREYVGKHFPDLPFRRALFVETDTRLSVYAHWSDRVAEDLRHEVAHGYLHAVVPGLPLWLDEGLAEYFEVPRGRDGLNVPHVEELLRDHGDNRWQPNLARLEYAVSTQDMGQRDYAEAWAWVHWMLETTPSRRRLFQAHLMNIRETGKRASLAQNLAEHEAGDVRAALVQHLREQQRRATTASPRAFRQAAHPTQPSPAQESHRKGTPPTLGGPVSS
jgi:hypothetical protein